MTLLERQLNISLPKSPAIYCIYFIGDIERVYYGSTKNLNNRIVLHINFLIKQKHPNYKLQNVFNRFGIYNFRVKIIDDFKLVPYNKGIATIKEKKLIKSDSKSLNIRGKQ